MDYCFASIKELHCAFLSKKLTVKELVLIFLERIARIDKGESGLNAVLEINPDVLFIADELDKRLTEGCGLTPLFGVPLLIKDNIDTNDKMHTSAGSAVLKNNYSSRDAFIIKKLRAAGAVILGKANMTEFANFMTDGEMPDGYSFRGGQVLNPHDKAITPSGSSSGSAVAVAAGLCTAAVGTETCGSIVSPAGQNGVLGLKPTLGLVSRSGVIPIAHTLDTPGPLTRTAEDAAVLMDVLCGFDENDASTHSIPNSISFDLGKSSLKGLKIGVYSPEEQENVPKECEQSFAELMCKLSSEGAIITKDIEISCNFNIWHITKYEFKADMSSYLSGIKGEIKTLGDIISYNEAHKDTALKYGQSTFLSVENDTSGTMTEPEYLNELLNREEVIKQFDSVFTKYDIDVILCRTFNNIIAPYTGFPSIILPTGKQSHGRPVDCYLMARRFEDSILLQAANEIENLLQVSLRPRGV